MVLHASTPQTGFFQQLSRRSSADVQRLFSRARETMLNNSSDLTQSPCRSTAILPIVVTESLNTSVRVCVLSCVLFRIPVFSHVALTHSHMPSDLCAPIHVRSHVYALFCVFFCVLYSMHALICVFSFACSSLCAVMCALSFLEMGMHHDVMNFVAYRLGR